MSLGICYKIPFLWHDRAVESLFGGERVYLDLWGWLLETFSLIARLNSIRVVISLIVFHDWPLYQLDVKNAFFVWRVKRRSVYEASSWVFCLEGVWLGV